MSGQAIREEMYRIIDGIDESKLEVVVNRWKDDLKVIGYKPDGEPITVAEMRKNLELSQKQYEKGQYTSIDDLEKESLTW